MTATNNAAALLIAVVLTVAGCKSGSTPSSPSPTPPPGGGTGGGGGGGGTPVPTNTITISNNMVSPQLITVSLGSRVMFINNDTRAHEMHSDPHPEHGDCPALNDIGFLQPGQMRSTGNLNDPGTCGFHDHNLPNNANLKGQIVIQ